MIDVCLSHDRCAFDEQKVAALHKDHAALRAMGFSEGQCLRALAACNNAQDAVQWLFAGKVIVYIRSYTQGYDIDE